MNTNSLRLISEILLPVGNDRKTKDDRNRLKLFVDWLQTHGYNLDEPHLAEYRDALLFERRLAPNSVKAHLATIRGRYKTLLKDETLHHVLYDFTNARLPDNQRKTLAEAALGRLMLALRPDAAPLQIPVSQPRNLNRTDEDINNLFRSLKLVTQLGLRDAAVIMLMATTGIRENEVCALDVSDLRHQHNGNLALHVPVGRGCVKRLVPYEDNEWVLEVVDVWLGYTKTSSGPVFRGFYKSGNLIRENRLSPRAVENLIANYPIVIDDQPVILKPLDLRHAYAGHLYRQGLDAATIQQYLGLKRVQTVWDYIGGVGRAPFQAYLFDLNRLDGWRVG